MKITYPHLGNTYIPIESLLQGLGHEPITPPLGTTRTLELGGRLSPEQICLPFKIILGNMLEGLALGAEEVWMIGGWGPCRLGYYGEVQRILLEQAKGDVGFFLLEMPRGNVVKIRELINSVLGNARIKTLGKGGRLAWTKLLAVEQLEEISLQVRPREEKKGSTSEILGNYLQEIRQSESIDHIRSLTKKGEQDLLGNRKTSKKSPTKVALIGEIYTVVEPLANLNLEERLGELGVEVVRTISLRNWVQDHIFKKLVGQSHLGPLKRSAHGYLHSFVGGHGLESIAHSVESAKSNIHGIIQILPVGCMPEIIAQGILPKVGVDYNLPILSIVVDEHAGEVGVQTRLEAFVDVLERRMCENG